MKFIDQKVCELVALVAVRGGRVHYDDPVLASYKRDRQCLIEDIELNTLNMCLAGGLLSEIQIDDDSFAVELGPRSAP